MRSSRCDVCGETFRYKIPFEIIHVEEWEGGRIMHLRCHHGFKDETRSDRFSDALDQRTAQCSSLTDY